MTDEELKRFCREKAEVEELLKAGDREPHVVAEARAILINLLLASPPAALIVMNWLLNHQEQLALDMEKYAHEYFNQ